MEEYFRHIIFKNYEIAQVIASMIPVTGPAVAMEAAFFFWMLHEVFMIGISRKILCITTIPVNES